MRLRSLLTMFLMTLAIPMIWSTVITMKVCAQTPPPPPPPPPDDDDDDDDDDIIGAAGVVVDADGVLRKRTFADRTGEIARSRVAAARANLDPQIATASKMRKVSITRLEKILADRVAKKLPVTEDMKYLAGLTRVQYVFYYPETKDIVIAGPAEGWATDMAGRVRGIESGRPVIELQDLIVSLRSYAPDSKGVNVISCSIDPTQEGLARMQAFLKSIGSRATPGDAQYIVNGLRESLGLQTVRITGVPANTHFAQVLVEADYRMKLIGIGMERPPVRMVSYVEKANPASVSKNALQRWYFVPDYQCVQVSEDKLAMHLVGDGVKLVGADEMVTADGNRQKGVRVDKASQIFVTTFTKKYPELAAKSPVYAQLRNLIDLSMAAAFIQQQDYYGQAGWNLGLFADEDKYPVETYHAPKKVGTAVTAVVKGSKLMTPIGGGVSMQPKQALKDDNVLKDEEGKVAETYKQLDLSKLAADQWWWD